MSPHDCPTATQQRHEDNFKVLFDRSLPGWFRGLMITVLSALALAYCGSWAYSATTYATRTEVEKANDGLKQEMKEMRAEIRSDLKEISGKLEASRLSKP